MLRSKVLSSLLENQQSVCVKAYSRLHLGFFDLNGASGRKFGSLGISLDNPMMQLVARKSAEVKVEGGDVKRTESVIAHFMKTLNASALQGMEVCVTKTIPAHAGLGSGTQLALATGMAYSHLYALNLQPTQVAQITTRGARSGIGIGTFLHGGLVVDGGRGDNTLTPPIIARASFPEAWRIILIMDAHHQGLYGAQERKAFNQLAPASRQQAEQLCWHVLMQALPAIAEENLEKFGVAVQALQEATGDYFAPAQGGRYASTMVADVLRWLQAQGVQCVGQSSWGPTGFAVVANQSEALQLITLLKQQFVNRHQLSFVITSACNQGATVVSS